LGSTGYKIADDLDYRPGDCILEVGSERGEGSTGFLLEVARSHRVPFLTIDLRDGMTGEEYLRVEFPSVGLRIKFAYLDNFDWTYSVLLGSDLLREQRAFYRGHRKRLTNANSQQAHLEQAVEVARHAAPRAVVVVDDTWWTGHRFNGKGGTAVPYLLANGWELLEQPPVGRELTDSHVSLRNSP
jgi:hypothetical protein